MQNVVGLTLVAMATKFGLGAEIQSPTGLCNYLLTYLLTYVCHYNVAGALEKYVQALEKKHKFDLLKNLYASVNGRSIDDAQMVEFFKMKFWM